MGTLFKYLGGVIDEGEYMWTQVLINARRKVNDFGSNPVTALKLSVINADGRRHFAQFPLEKERPLEMEDLAKLLLLAERKLNIDVDVDDEVRALMYKVAGENNIG
jgi:hypothetical protein